jgi:predicted dinucleotide-binding enzyme
MDQLPAIAVLGGSGELGSALARRWAQAGYLVIIGSRTADRAIEAAALIGQQVRGAENVEAAKAAEVIVVAVPYSNHAGSSIPGANNANSEGIRDDRACL